MQKVPNPDALRAPTFLQLWSKLYFSAAKCRRRYSELYFFAEQKNNIDGAAGEKKIRVQCKNAAFTPQSHSKIEILLIKKKVFFSLPLFFPYIKTGKFILPSPFIKTGKFFFYSENLNSK